MKKNALLLILMLICIMPSLAQGNECLPPLHVDGKWIKDANGNQVTLHGVNIYLQGTDCLDTPEEMLDMIDHAVDQQGFGEAKIIRLALIRRFVGMDYAEVYRKYIRPAIDHCKKRNLYLIVYFHTFPNKYGNTFQELIDFWEYTAPRVANDDNILLACANEPVYSRDLEGFNIVRQNMQQIVNTIRKYAKKQIIIAQGTSWTNYIAPYADNPLNDPAKSFNNGQNNIMYEAHIYPHNWGCQANGSQNKWNQMVGKVPDKFPVLIGEWSPKGAHGCNTNQRAYLDNFADWLSKMPNVSATAWNLGNCGDNHIMLNTDKSLNQWGQDWKAFVKQNTYHVSCEAVDTSKLLTNLGTGNYLQLTTEDAGGNKTFVRASNTFSGEQVRWQLRDAGNSYYHIYNPQQGGRHLFCSEEVAGNNQLHVYSAPTSWTGDYTQWRRISAGNGYYTLENKGTGHILYCSQETAADGSYKIYAVPASLESDFTKWKWEEPRAKTTYTLTASASAGGAISPSGEIVADSATSQTFTIIPEEGYEIASVLIDGVTADPVESYTFSHIVSDHNIVANFETSSAQQAYQGPHTIPGKIEAEYFDMGGEAIAYQDDASRSGDLAFRPGEMVDVGSKAAASNGYSVGWTAEGEWLEYTIDTVEAGTYDIYLTYASGSSAPGQLQITLDDASVGTFGNLTNSGGWEAFTTAKISNITLTAGSQQVLRAAFVNGAGLDIDAIEFIPVTPLPQLGQTVWLRAKTSAGYVYRNANNSRLYANGSASTSEAGKTFQILDAGSGYVFLRNAASGQYVQALTYAGDQLNAQGTSNDKARWKLKDAGNGYILLENKHFTGQHMRTNEGIANKSVDCYGSTGNWSQFSWGLSTTNARQANSTTKKGSLQSESATGMAGLELKVYPNPSSGIYQLLLKENTNVQVLDMTGRTVYSSYHLSGTSSLNLSSLSSGLYVLVVKDQRFKLVKE